MSWSFAENVLHLEFDALWTTAVALLLLILGYGLRRKLRFFEKFCIPAPVIGGLIMAIVALILHHNGGATIKFTTALQSPMMLAFFTTVGIGGSLALIAKGGKALVIYLQADADTIWERVKDDTTRPLLQASDKDTAYKNMCARLESREASYLAGSDVVVSAVGAKEEVFDRVKKLLLP